MLSIFFSLFLGSENVAVYGSESGKDVNEAWSDCKPTVEQVFPESQVLTLIVKCAQFAVRPPSSRPASSENSKTTV